MEVKHSIYLTISEGGVCSLENNADVQVSGEEGLALLSSYQTRRSPEALMKGCSLFGTFGVASRFCLWQRPCRPQSWTILWVPVMLRADIMEAQTASSRSLIVYKVGGEKSGQVCRVIDMPLDILQLLIAGVKFSKHGSKKALCCHELGPSQGQQKLHACPKCPRCRREQSGTTGEATVWPRLLFCLFVSSRLGQFCTCGALSIRTRVLFLLNIPRKRIPGVSRHYVLVWQGKPQYQLRLFIRSNC